MKKIVILIALIFIVVAVIVVGVVWLDKDEEIAVVTTDLNPDALPLYDGVHWSTEEETEVYSKAGILTTSEVLQNITNIAEVTIPFKEYYRSVLLTRGWEEDITLAAGGPGSAVVAYTKNGAYVIVSFQSQFLVQNENEPGQCPCTVQFSVFTSTKNDTDSPLDAAEDTSVTEENLTERYVGTVDRVKVVFEHTDYAHYRLTTNELVREGELNTERGYKDDIDATVYVLNWQQPEGEQMRYVRLTASPGQLYLLDTDQEIVSGSVLTLE